MTVRTPLTAMQCDIVNALYKMNQFASTTYIAGQIQLSREFTPVVVHDACKELCSRGILKSSRIASPRNKDSRIKGFQLTEEMRAAMDKEFAK